MANPQASLQKRTLSIATCERNFLPAKVLYNISGLRGLTISSALHSSLARVQGFSLMVTTHNSTELKGDGMTEDIFIYIFFWVRKFLYAVTRHKKVHACANNFCVSFFSALDIH